MGDAPIRVEIEMSEVEYVGEADALSPLHWFLPSRLRRMMGTLKRDSRDEAMMRLAEAVVALDAARESYRSDRGDGFKSKARFYAEEQVAAALARVRERRGV